MQWLWQKSYKKDAFLPRVKEGLEDGCKTPKHALKTLSKPLSTV